MGLGLLFVVGTLSASAQDDGGERGRRGLECPEERDRTDGGGCGVDPAERGVERGRRGLECPEERDRTDGGGCGLDPAERGVVRGRRGLECPEERDRAAGGDPCPIDPRWAEAAVEVYGPCVCAPDEDGDGVPDLLDVCPMGDDTIDTDGDGAPDDCDPCPVDLDDDPDGDLTCSSDDSCPLDYDPTGRDTDGDGRGDVCDPLPGGDLLLSEPLRVDLPPGFEAEGYVWLDVDGARAGVQVFVYVAQGPVGPSFRTRDLRSATDRSRYALDDGFFDLGSARSADEAGVVRTWGVCDGAVWASGRDALGRPRAWTPRFDAGPVKGVAANLVGDDGAVEPVEVFLADAVGCEAAPVVTR